MADLRAHDLLFLRQPQAFDTGCPGAGWPEWLHPAWLAKAPLVVRRALAGPGQVAVGVRGLARNERCAGQVLVADIARSVTPGMLARAVVADPQRFALAGAALPCVSALLALAPQLEALALDWGPAGGVGFWLASGLPVLRPGSDLDLLVRAPRPLSKELLSALTALHSQAACRVDIQVDTGEGGFALMEYARGGKVMLKTARGPLLVRDPWLDYEPA